MPPPSTCQKELADKRALREQVRQAMDDLASQEGLRHINLTDKDARLMKTRHGIVPGYNAQSMVSPIEVDDEASGMLITAVDVVDDPTDYGQFTPMLIYHELWLTPVIGEVAALAGGRGRRCQMPTWLATYAQGCGPVSCRHNVS